MTERGRETKEENALFYLCSLIEYIGRKTKNTRRAIVQQLGTTRLKKILSLADVYHCDTIERVADDFITEANIADGSFDNVAACRYALPTHWDIGKVYKRLILAVALRDGTDFITALEKVYASFISAKIDDYNLSVYYDSPASHVADYYAGHFANEQ